MYRISAVWIILAFLVFAILDLTALNYIKIFDVKPDIFLIGVIFFALYGGLGAGVLGGFASGLIRDIFTGGPFGVNIVFFTLAGIFLGYNFSKFYRNSPVAQMILSFLVSFSYVFFYDIFLTKTGIWKSAGILFSLYTAIAAPLLFFMLSKTLILKR